jgi:hypothetical protein
MLHEKSEMRDLLLAWQHLTDAVWTRGYSELTVEDQAIALIKGV